MSSEKDHIGLRKRILSYLKGELSPREEFELEKKALEDPFVQEALEGLESQDPGIVENDLASLSSRILKRRSRRFIYRVAASLLILLAVSAIWLLLPERTDEKLAQREEEPAREEKEVIPQEVPILEQEAEELIPEEKPASAPPETEPQNATESQSIPDDRANELVTKEPPVKMESESITSKPAVPELSPELAEIADRDIAEEDPEVSEEVIPDENAMSFAITREAEFDTEENKAKKNVSGMARSAVHQSTKSVYGKVVTSEGEGLPGVNVIIKGTNQGVITDFEGNFELEAAENSELVVSFIGMTRREVPVTLNDSMRIVLTEDVETLSEVVVTNAGKSLNTPAGPLGGDEEFNRYVSENKRSVEGEPGKVVLRVTLSETGDIRDIQVVRSLSPAQNQEAIRLINEYRGFSPGILDGKPEESVIRLKIDFN